MIIFIEYLINLVNKLTVVIKPVTNILYLSNRNVIQCFFNNTILNSTDVEFQLKNGSSSALTQLSETSILIHSNDSLRGYIFCFICSVLQTSNVSSCYKMESKYAY